MSVTAQPAGRQAAPAPLDLVQDFVNTEIPEWQRDDIATPVLLAAWLEARELLPPGSGASEPEFVLARELRRGLRLLALAHTLERPPPDGACADLDAVLVRLPVRLTVGADGLLVVPAGEGAVAALAAIAATALAAERDGTWSRLKACRKESCGWVFYDASRNRSSTWCSMQICGNRVKARSARRRRGHEGGDR